MEGLERAGPGILPPAARGSRDRLVLAAAILLASAGAWVLVVWLSREMDDGGEAMLTMGMAAWLFLLTWAAMMAAMMLPAASPMIDAYARVQSRRQEQAGAAFLVAAFIGGYLLIWMSTGALAFGAARGIERLAADHMWLMEHGARLGGVVFIAAGVYEISPLKEICLGRCRTPMSFIVTSWRDGATGAVRMGIEHGTFCLGCCWLLFALLFPLGIMNVAAMAAMTLLIIAQKLLPARARAAQLTAVALIGYGVLVVIFPVLLPSTI